MLFDGLAALTEDPDALLNLNRLLDQLAVEQPEGCRIIELKYFLGLGNKEAAEREGPPCVTVTKDGPYAVSGGVELAGVTFGDGAPKGHYTLCRCGASRNKPFCDGTHWEIGFRDPA